MSLKIYKGKLLRGGTSLNGDTRKAGEVVRLVQHPNLSAYWIILKEDLSWGAWVAPLYGDVQILGPEES